MPFDAVRCVADTIELDVEGAALESDAPRALAGDARRLSDSRRVGASTSERAHRRIERSARPRGARRGRQEDRTHRGAARRDRARAGGQRLRRHALQRRSLQVRSTSSPSGNFVQQLVRRVARRRAIAATRSRGTGWTSAIRRTRARSGAKPSCRDSSEPDARRARVRRRRQGRRAHRQPEGEPRSWSSRPSTVTSPPSRRAMRLAIERPSPAPGGRRRRGE